MNTERFDKGDYPPRNNTRIFAIVGVCVGVGLLVFGTPAGFPVLAGPAASGLWPVLAIVCLSLGLIALTGGLDTWSRRERDSATIRTEMESDDDLITQKQHRKRLLLQRG